MKRGFYLKIIDLSQTLNNKMPIFPEDPDFLIEEITKSEKDGFTLSILKTGLHAGTHIDAPYHFFSSGRKIIEIKLDELIESSSKSVKIIDLSHLSSSGDNSLNNQSNVKINRELFSKINIEKGDIILIQTNWSDNWGLENYFTDNPYLTYELAEFLVDNKIRGLAIDGPSVDKFGETIIHEKLLSNDIWIIENLKDLKKIPSTESLEFFFIPLPLNSEASPIRAFIKIDD